MSAGGSLLGPRFEDALVTAARLHREQTRKGGRIPYVAHLLAVAALVLEAGGDEDEAIAALLHDAVEDQGGDKTRQEIRQQFGERVAAIVDGCTDTDQHPKPPWQGRKEAFIASLASASPSVRLVVAADKLHNALSTLENLRYEGEAVWERFRSREQALWFYRSVVEALEQAGGGPLVDRLHAAIDALETTRPAPRR